jgi:dGTPase
MPRYTAADAERRTPEAGKAGDEREPWEIDRARILHSGAFRRLQRKTQVFGPGDSDFSRTRLTHSIEVAQIAKSIALRLGANPTLCEAASLAHDIGHPPFGHAGEHVLNECMAASGGFEGNAQNLRVLATLEIKSDAYTGLNLTRGTIDALLKYKRSHSEARASGHTKFVYDDDLPLVDWVCHDRRDDRTSFECQIMDWADDVAYSVHDVEDGMWAGLITLPRLRARRARAAVAATVPEAAASMVVDIFAELERILSVGEARSSKAALKMWTSATINDMVQAAVAEPADEDGRGPRYSRRLCVDPNTILKRRLLTAVALEIVFPQRRVASIQPRAERIVGGVFRAVTANPALIPAELRSPDVPRSVCDYVASMTDDAAARAFHRLSTPTPSGRGLG